MTYLSIISRAKQICHQPSGENQGRWTDTVWLEVLNQIQLEAVDESEAIITKVTDTKTVADMDYVDIPSTIISPTIVYLDKNRLIYKDPKTLSEIDADWVGADSGLPTYFYFTDGKIYFNCPAKEVYDMVIFGTKDVTDMSSSQPTPFEGYTYLQPYHKLLVKGLSVEFFSDTGDIEKKKEYLADWESGKAKMRFLVHRGAEEGDMVFQPKAKVYVSEVS